MERAGFRVMGWLALAGAVASWFAAALLALSGTLVLAGQTSYPFERSAGPLALTGTVTVPVDLAAPVCVRADASDQLTGTECFRFFLHDDEAAGRTAERAQDADLRPRAAALSGEVDLATDSGWNAYVALRVGGSVLTAVLVALGFQAVRRLLAGAASGTPFTDVAVLSLRRLGILVLLGSLLGPVLDQVSRLDLHGYWTESFGVAPALRPADDLGLQVAGLLAGVLLLLLAAVFRHGARLEAEQALTV